MKFLSDRGKSLLFPVGLLIGLALGGYWFYDSLYGTGLWRYKLKFVQIGDESWLADESGWVVVDGDILKYAMTDRYVFGYKDSHIGKVSYNPNGIRSSHADGYPDGYFIVNGSTHSVTPGLDKAAFDREVRETYNLDPKKIRFKDVD